MACGMQSKTARRAVGLATTATLEVFEEIGSYRKAIPRTAAMPRTTLSSHPLLQEGQGEARRKAENNSNRMNKT